MANNEDTTLPSKEIGKPAPQPELTPGKEKEKALPEVPAEELTPSDKRVKELEVVVEQLKKNALQAQNMQSIADKKARIEKIERKRLERRLKKFQSGDTTVPPEDFEGGTALEKEVRKDVRIGVQGLLLDKPEYQELIKRDKTLKEVLKNNPLALLEEYFDAEDAIEQITDKLNEMVSSSKPQPEEEKEKGKEDEGKEFKAPAQPGGESPEPIKEEGKKDLPKGSEPRLGSIEESIKNKINFT